MPRTCSACTSNAAGEIAKAIVWEVKRQPDERSGGLSRVGEFVQV